MIKEWVRSWLPCPLELRLEWLRDELSRLYIWRITELEAELQCADAVPYWVTISHEAKKRGFDRFLVAGLIGAESGFNPYAVGDNGASRGLPQLSWPAYQDVRDAQATKGGWLRDTFDPWTAIPLGLDYLVQCRTLCAAMGQPGVRWALACYNWGKGKMQRHLGAGMLWEELPQEVRDHVLEYFAQTEDFRRRCKNAK